MSTTKSSVEALVDSSSLKPMLEFGDALVEHRLFTGETDVTARGVAELADEVGLEALQTIDAWESHLSSNAIKVLLAIAGCQIYPESEGILIQKNKAGGVDVSQDRIVALQLPMGFGMAGYKWTNKVRRNPLENTTVIHRTNWNVHLDHLFGHSDSGDLFVPMGGFVNLTNRGDPRRVSFETKTSEKGLGKIALTTTAEIDTTNRTNREAKLGDEESVVVQCELNPRRLDSYQRISSTCKIAAMRKAIDGDAVLDLHRGEMNDFFTARLTGGSFNLSIQPLLRLPLDSDRVQGGTIPALAFTKQYIEHIITATQQLGFQDTPLIRVGHRRIDRVKLESSEMEIPLAAPVILALFKHLSLQRPLKDLLEDRRLVGEIENQMEAFVLPLINIFTARENFRRY